MSTTIETPTPATRRRPQAVKTPRMPAGMRRESFTLRLTNAERVAAHRLARRIGQPGNTSAALRYGLELATEHLQGRTG